MRRRPQYVLESPDCQLPGLFVGADRSCGSRFSSFLSLSFAWVSSTCSLAGARTQSRRRRTVSGRMMSWYLPRLNVSRMRSATPQRKLTISLWFKIQAPKAIIYANRDAPMKDAGIFRISPSWIIKRRDRMRQATVVRGAGWEQKVPIRGYCFYWPGPETAARRFRASAASGRPGSASFQSSRNLR